MTRSSSGSAVTGGTISGTSGTINQGADTDTLSGFEDYQLTAQGDLLTFDVDALAAATLDGLGGNDTINIIDAGGTTLTTAGGTKWKQIALDSIPLWNTTTSTAA